MDARVEIGRLFPHISKVSSLLNKPFRMPDSICRPDCRQFDEHMPSSFGVSRAIYAS